MPKIVTLTVNPAIDKGLSVDRVVPEHKLRCTDATIDPGGGGINVARAISRLGGEALALWSRGGLTGDLLARLLDDEDLTHRGVPVAQSIRENLTVQEESSEEQYRFVLPGPELDEEEQKEYLDTLRSLESPDFLVLSGSLPPGVGADFYARVARSMPSGCRVVVDTKGAALEASLCSAIYLIKPNLRELGGLAGKEVDSDPEIQRAARDIIDREGAQVVLVSLGRGGAVLVTAEVYDQIRSPTVPIRSKVGAGDSMVGGTVLSLARGMPLAQAARFGVAAGAAAVMTPGTELCRRSDTEELFRELREE